jgi:hypothetical protein
MDDSAERLLACFPQHVIWGVIHFVINVSKVVYSLVTHARVARSLTPADKEIHRKYFAALSQMEFTAVKRRWWEITPRRVTRPVTNLLECSAGNGNTAREATCSWQKTRW